MTRAYYRVDYAEFVKVFIKHDCDEIKVAAELGISPLSVQPLATRLRKSGVKLPRKNNPRPTKAYVDELNDIVKAMEK